jgi:predicted transposase YdaD
MSKPFDATPKGLLEIRPADWPAFLGVATRAVEVVDADVSTVTAATDKVLLLRADEGDRIQHFDFQSGPDASVPRRTHGYNALLEERHELPVDSVVVLLRPQANLGAINGVYERRLPGTPGPYLQFRYRVVHVWELPVETVLKAGLSLLPFAPISAARENELPAVIERMKQRLEAEADPTIAGKLWTATKVLLGLRCEAEFIEQLLQGVREMKESTTYQAILEEGRQEERPVEARRVLLRVGADRFGAPPTPEQQAILEAITDANRLEELAVRAGHVRSWAELLEQAPPPAAPPRRARRKKSP